MGLATPSPRSHPVDTPTAPASPAARRRAILAELAAMRDPQQRLQWTVERARARPPLPESARTDAHRVHGCMARLWWVAMPQGHQWRLAADSDAVTLKALVGLLAECYDGESSQGILADPPDFLERLGLLRQLAENRRATVLRVAQALVQQAMQSLPCPTPAPPCPGPLP